MRLFCHALLLVFLIFPACQAQENEILKVPWFVQQRVYNEGLDAYAYQDSLRRYGDLSIEEVINESNYYSYLANLIYAASPERKNEIKQLLEAAFNADSIGFCANHIEKVYNYLKPINRPHRRYSMPFIVDFNLNYFLELRQRCEVCCSGNDSYEEIKELNYKDLFLSIAYISLRDQWHRIPQRKPEPEKQIEFDSLNRVLLDTLITKYELPKGDKKIRSTIFVSLLHSTDCDWTDKWIKIYMDYYRGYEKYESHLKHFLWRSDCTDKKLEEWISKEIESMTDKKP